MISGKDLREIARIMLNIDRDQLEQDGIIKPGQVGGSDWKRFSNEPLMFILKLPPDRLDKLAALVSTEMREKVS